MSFSKMFGNVGKQMRPRLSRSFSQVLAEPMAWNQAPTKLTTLPNGIRVATKQTFGEVSSMGVFIDAGVRDETKATAGAAHLVESLALSGTKKRPKAQLETEVEGMGATLSMTAGREQSNYLMTVMKGDEAKAADILGDLVANAPVENLAKEREAILRNLEETDNTTRAVIEDRLHQCAFRDGPLGFSGIGPFDGLDSITSEHLKAYVDSAYTADKMVIAVAGPVDHDALVNLAQKSFGSLKAGAPRPVADKPYFCGAELLYRNDEMGATAYISVAWEGVSYKNADALTFMLMQSIIGSYTKNTGLVPGNLSGNRVINAVANKMAVGCADHFEAFNINYRDTGVFGWYAACDEVAVEHCIGEMMFGVNLLAYAVTDEEVERGKRTLIAQLVGGGQSSEETCAKVGKDILAYGRGLPAAEMITRINAIDSEEIKRVAWKYLNDQELSVTALGPLHGMPQYYDLRRASYMHRY